MQRWEYLILSAESDQQGWHPRWLNFEELQSWRMLQLLPYMNQLGEQGWELISDTPQQHSGAWTYLLVFKRPKA